MGCLGKISFLVVVASLVAGVALNVAVAASCEYLQASSNQTNIELGVFRYSVNAPGNEFDTGGECKDYDGDGDLGWQVKTAQACTIIAAVFGAILVLIVIFTQCCCPIPCMGPVIGFSYFGCLVGTALVWLVRKNKVCDTVLGGCDWGEAAGLNLSAQLVYIAAAIFHRCLPDPKVAQAERRADRAEGEKNRAEQQHEAELGQINSSNAEKDAEIKRLQTQLDEQKSALAKMEEENKKSKAALATATAATSTAAVAEAAKIKSLKEELAHTKAELDDAKASMAAMEKDNKKTKADLATATAVVTSTAAVAEAAEIKSLKEELAHTKAELDDAMASMAAMEKDNKKTKAALATATAATSTAAVAEAAEIKSLKEELDHTKAELDDAKASMAAMEKDNKKTKAALATATAATSTAAVAEAAEIKSLKEELDCTKAELDDAKESMAAMEKDNKKTKAALAAATAATSTAAVGEAAKLKSVQEQLEDTSNELEELKAELTKLRAQEAPVDPPMDVDAPVDPSLDVDASERTSVHIDDTHIDDSQEFLWQQTSGYPVRINHKVGFLMLNETEMSFNCIKDESASQTFFWSDLLKVQRNPKGQSKALLKVTASSGESTVVQFTNREKLDELYAEAKRRLKESKQPVSSVAEDNAEATSQENAEISENVHNYPEDEVGRPDP
jgi:hypothetical protein